MTMCTCNHQLQPHRRLPNVCPEPPRLPTPMLTYQERVNGVPLIRIGATWTPLWPTVKGKE